MTGWSNTSTTARCSALDPSRTARTGRVTSRPRSRSPTHSSVTRVAFSVEPSTSANGCLTPSMSMPRATTQHDWAKCTPSTINATRSTPDRSAASRSARAVSVIFTNHRETADFDVAVAELLTAAPTGSRPVG